jgi:hypothetical protein
MNNDSKVMIMALQKEREELHQRLMQIDRIIKKVRNGLFDEPQEAEVITIPESVQPALIPQSFSDATNIKVQVLRVFDKVQKASSLKTFQREYNKLTGNNYNIRETIRSLHKSKLITIIREKGASRGFMWAKTQWIENGLLLDQFKPEGFDLLYNPDNLIFE